MTSKIGLINKIQANDTYHSTALEDNESLDWRSLPEIATSSEDSDMCDTNRIE